MEKAQRGFAVMDPTKRAEIASKGGKAAHAAGTAHRFTKEEAALAGKKGGLAPHATRGGPPGYVTCECGKKNSKRSKFCGQCGKSLIPE